MPFAGSAGMLPLELSSFVGRHEITAAVGALVGQVPLVTLTGPGGVGKTRIAIRVADRVRNRLADGVVFIGLSEITDAEQVAGVVASTLRLAVDDAVTHALRGTLPESPRGPTAAVQLTPREREVADMLAQGFSNRKIAATLLVSLPTAEGHVERLRTKLGASTRKRIVEWVLAGHWGPADPS